MTTTSSPIQQLVDATIWSTAKLASWALTWYGTDGRTPIWPAISGSQEDARAFYATLEEEELRWCAAEVLVEFGWTFEAICRKKS